VPGDWGFDRDADRSAPLRPPHMASEEQRATWRGLGEAKFQDREYQRYAQSFRTTESLRESGRHGYQETARRYGREFASDLLANHRREQPTRPEREMIGLLGELGKQEGRDYQREYKVAPGVYADFAWPERKVAVEVHGGAHQAAFFLEKGMEAREQRRTETYAREGWTVHVVTDRDLREGREETQARMRETLGGVVPSGRR
jgi:very-short-patch-repair endonuclease